MDLILSARLSVVIASVKCYTFTDEPIMHLGDAAGIARNALPVVCDNFTGHDRSPNYHQFNSISYE